MTTDTNHLPPASASPSPTSAGSPARPPSSRRRRLADERGYSSIWALDRLLAPIAPRVPYPASPDGALPEEQRIVFDPLVTLTLAAAVTHRVRIGTSVLVAPWYSPALLARSLTSLDHVSGGRLTVGLGLGWSVDEYEAVGVSAAAARRPQ